MPIRQKDIAKRTGISRALISHALNGRPNVASSTRQLILKTAREMGYRSDSTARRLAGRRNGVRESENTIYVILPAMSEFPNDRSGQLLHDIPYFSDFLRGIESAADVYGVDLLCSSIRRSGRLPRVLLDAEVDGVLLLTLTPEIESQFADVDIAKLVLGRESKVIPGIVPDDEAGMHAITEHVLSLGHRHVGYIGHAADHNAITQRRFSGYRKALQAAGIAPNAAWEDTTLLHQSRDCASKAAKTLLSRTPSITALICYNDIHAMGAIEGLQEIGVVVPRMVSVTGFDDASVGYGFAPAITSVAYDRQFMGRLAVQRIIAVRDSHAGDKTASHPLLTIVATSVVIRESTARPPALP